DGVAEVWFESAEALMEGMSTPEGQKLGAALLEDEKNFVDHSKSSAFIVEEHEFN
ncbi:MAG: EthD domain-containing protein, partial [Candidatus Thiodiazotropha taylori]|nr:EthD domain-containing protein [Candidatus Thiodiazotropha taylori]